MDTKSPAPPGAYVELDASLIDEGRMLETLSAKIRSAHRDLLEYEKCGDRGGKAVIVLKVNLMRMKGSEEFFEIDYAAEVKTPSVVRATQVRDGNGRLLCQPAGSNESTPDQQLYLDRNGRIIGMDTETGEMSRPIAGRIERKTAQG